MLRIMEQVRWRSLLVGLVVAAGLVLTGCGGEDQCAGVDCDFGECDSQTGQCINAEQCHVDEECLAGYECRDHACEPVEACDSDAECEAGICEGGACVNPSSCEEDDDCVAGTFCGPDGTCEPDPCNEVTCQRGVCQRGTDTCVSAGSCTPATEVKDCIAGEKCAADNTCKPEGEFCDGVDCARGVCDFEAGGCTNADDCQGDDELCAEGFYCNSEDECQPDKCERNNVYCDEGVCIPSVGACENAEACEDSSDCLDDHACVDGTCTLEARACGEESGEGGCPGNQICEIVDGEASCLEPDECKTSLDCADDRQCGGRHCLEATDCADDYFEPNESADDATAFFEAASDNTLSANVCASDVDFYTFDSVDFGGAAMRGTLLVEVDVPRRDVGLGQIEVEVTDPAGVTYTADSGSLGEDGKAIIDTHIGVADHGDYTVEVRAADDVTRAGVNYDLSINLLPRDSVDACEDALVLTGDQRVTGNTEESDSSAMGSECTGEDNPSNEVVFAYEVDTPQEVTFELTPQVSWADVSMSLRGRCTQASTEVRCANDGGENEPETLTALLDEGTHYLVVQSPEGVDGGAFQLDIETIHTTCGTGGNYCEDLETASLCTPNGGRFLSVDCEKGCDPTTGGCVPPAGDSCNDAPTLRAVPDEENDADEGTYTDYGETIDLLVLNDNYGLSAGEETCLGEDIENTRTKGPERSYEIELPPETGFVADVAFTNEVKGSMYLVEDCSSADETCIDGALDSTDSSTEETLSYSNRSEEEETVYLVIDTDEGQNYEAANLEIDFRKIVCEPGATRCTSDNSAAEVCHEAGVKWEHQETCDDWRCVDFDDDAAQCSPPNNCQSALDVTSQAKQGAGVTYDGEWVDFDNEIEGDFNCGPSGYQTDGEDIWFKVDLQDGETISTSLEVNGFMYPAVMIITDCSNPYDSCVAGDTGWSDASASYTASGDETVYFIADHDWPASPGETYDVEIEVE